MFVYKLVRFHCSGVLHLKKYIRELYNSWLLAITTRGDTVGNP